LISASHLPLPEKNGEELMRFDRIPHARLTIGLAAAVLMLLPVAASTLKHSTQPVRLATADAASPAESLRTAPADAQFAARQPGGANTRALALVIGNAGYRDDAPLRQAADDAGAMAAEMRARGFDVTSAENLTKQGMLDAFARFAAKIAPGDTALVFFSGHGIQSGRQTYLIPVNAEIWREDDVRRDGLALDPLLADLDAHGAAAKLVVIDAARRNPFERRFRGSSIGLAPVSAPKGTLVIYSVAPGEIVHEADSGLFVGELIAQMRREGASVEQVFNRTRITVATASHQEQVPGVFSSLTEDVSLPHAADAAARQAAPH
jgi:uncharacterized caspase-like protein